jgi:hypothetical protein
MDFMKREKRQVAVLFGNMQDPLMQQMVPIVSALASQRTRVVIADVGIIPIIGANYNIKAPTLAMMYFGLIVTYYTGNPCDMACLSRFLRPPSRPRWRPSVY